MYLVLIVVAWMYIPSIDSLDCYSCSKVDNITSCQTMATCENNEKCYTESINSGNQSFFQLGCRPQDQCFKTVNQSPAIVGRSVANQNNCSICCSLTGCNRDLCGFGNQLVNTKAPCVDDPAFDCVKFGSLLNVCGDVQKAKLICRKYCGLCDLVDGAWTGWGSWGNCDVTCGQGHLTRTRACTNPAPEHGGLDCVGFPTESTSCNLKICPINGQWSVWAAWESCSVTCDTGLQRRHRNCSNPSPSPDGHCCFGDNLDVRICSETQCSVDGQLTSWDSWAACTATCGGGKEIRGRVCIYPTGVPKSNNCTGDVSQARDCNQNACPALQNFTTCYKCDHISDPKACVTQSVCASNEMCFATTTVVANQPRYSLGCQRSQLCLFLMTRVFAHMKLCAGPNPDPLSCGNAVGKRSSKVCQSCCNDSGCNYGSCEDMKDTLFKLYGVLDTSTLKSRV